MSTFSIKISTALAAAFRLQQLQKVLLPVATTSIRNLHRHSTMSYQLEERGTPNTLDYRIYYKKDGVAVSPFHDIPWKSSTSPLVYNMVVEVPRWSNSKMEIATTEQLNPIKQDVKKGNLRYVANTYPYKGYIWNYGAIPQTWENPNHTDSNTGQTGDNDPIDVCEIGSRVCERGEIIQVKVLGVLAMIDEGETDWKIIAIDVNDPDAAKLNDISDIEAIKPGYLDDTRNWFRVYKVADGKPFNSFAFDGQFKNREFAEGIIAETNQFWNELIAGTVTSNLDITNTTCTDSPNKITAAAANEVIQSKPVLSRSVPITDKKATAWFYLPRE
uniref:inorganic pyrophosphatase-like isoform X1 n=1 Tax=Ciona intestinalis TaxID=7719 RepID=UPI0002B8DBBE|nr:inorganic pyrophosphatase-like isoform X1 [Ciona intestinalis]|eukprot:XP_002124420.2 inorganic pyrophosphatase-like isoform X1 [Ciona intestinalis]